LPKVKHYLDYNATAPVKPEVLEVMRELQALPLNPSSSHELGRMAKNAVDNARRTIAEAVGAFANEVVFTASGTEANNWAIKVFPEHKVIISSIEHSSILRTAADATIAPVTKDGVVDIGKLEKLLPKGENFIVSVMLANNETGVIQPIKEITEMVHVNGGLMHCDAVQAFGKIAVDFTDLGCDLMTISAHKIGGPIGTAALIVKNSLAIKPFLTGGGQELNRRAGTENVAAIAGFAKAAEIIDISSFKDLKGWLEEFENEAEKLGGHAIGRNAPRLPNTICVTMPNVTSETQIISFDLEGIAISAGSACSSGRIEPSHVLTAMGLGDEETRNAIRISGGWATTQKDITAAMEAWKRIFQRKNNIAA
jgi:cysteine desulfurase